jgi:tryptophanyl-tRNA synthetase
MNDKPVILTGLRANNDLHIGNYFGAVLPMVDSINRLDNYQFNLFVPDLHSFTTPIDHTKLKASVYDLVTNYIALGLPIDNSNVLVYRQSRIPAHSELTWILSCFTGFGEMRRMTQFKDKATTTNDVVGADLLARDHNLRNLIQIIAELGEDQRLQAEQTLRGFIHQNTLLGVDKASVGLFSYPILMAADILLYDAQYVPVGEDQTQHLEFTRDIAERFNSKFNQEIFVVPKPVRQQYKFFGSDQGLRIRDLANPKKKMSKSADSDKGVIFLSDSPERARKKIMSATTDSLGIINYDYEHQPGVTNLLEILKLFGGEPKDYINKTEYGSLKSRVAELVVDFLSNLHNKRLQITTEEIEHMLCESENQANEQAQSTLNKAKSVLGL